MDIRKTPDKFLTISAEKVTLDEIKSKEFQDLIQEMKDKVLELDAVGLAATQIGVNKRVFVVRKEKNSKDLLVFINPKIISKKNFCKNSLESCLSIPGRIFKVPRYKSIVVDAMDESGKPILYSTSTKIVAFAIQHEIDHLNGILIEKRGKEVP